MASLGKTAFVGGSGKRYRFKVFALGTKFRRLSGVFVVTSRFRKDEGGYRHVPLYVGCTGDFSQPVEKHQKAAQFMGCGANCICVLCDDSEVSRLAKQRDLVERLEPVCNESAV